MFNWKLQSTKSKQRKSTYRYLYNCFLRNKFDKLINILNTKKWKSALTSYLASSPTHMRNQPPYVHWMFSFYSFWNDLERWKRQPCCPSIDKLTICRLVMKWQMAWNALSDLLYISCQLEYPYKLCYDIK